MTFRGKKKSNQISDADFAAFVPVSRKAAATDQGGSADIPSQPQRRSTPEISRAPERTSAPDIRRAPERISAPDIHRAPERTSAPDIRRAPERISAPDIRRAPERTSAPDIRRAPERTSAPDIRRAPERTSTPDIRRAPESTSAPDIHRAPERISAPEIRRAPERISAPDIRRAPERTSAPDIRRAPERTSAPDIRRTPDRASAPDIRRAPEVPTGSKTLRDPAMQSKPEGRPSVPTTSQTEWPDDYDGFSRISRHSQIEQQRLVAEVFTREQLRLFDTGSISELYYDLKKIAKANPHDINVFIGLGLCSMTVDEPVRAAEHFSKAGEIDKDFKPGIYIPEVEADDDGDWLIMAEALGHLGMLDAAVDVCDRVGRNTLFAGRIRARSSSAKQQIQQDFYTARERIITGNAPKQGETSWGKYRTMTLVWLIIGPVILLAIGSALFYSHHEYSMGKKLLGAGMYRISRIYAGDVYIDRTRSTEDVFAEASELLATAHSYNPYDSQIIYYQWQLADQNVKLGAARAHTKRLEWKPQDWVTARNNLKTARQNLLDEKLNNEQLLTLWQAWQEFQQQVKTDGATLLY